MPNEYKRHQPGTQLRDSRWPGPVAGGSLDSLPSDYDWAAIATRLEDLLADNDISERTYSFLDSLHSQLLQRGRLSDRQVASIEEVEQRRRRAGGRGF